MSVREEAALWFDHLSCDADNFGNVTLNNDTENMTAEEWALFCEDLLDLADINYLYIFFNFILFLVGFLGNGVIIIHILINGKIVRDLHSTYVLSLATSDLIYISLVPILAIQFYTRSFIFGLIPCKLLYFLDVFSNHASVYAIVLMCYDRMLAVLKPHTFSHRSRIKTRFTMTLVWLSGAVLALPNFIYGEVRGWSLIDAQLSCESSMSFVQQTVYMSVTYLVDFFAPLLITTVMYGCTIRGLYKRQRAFNSRQAGNAAHRPRSVNLRIVVLVLTIITTFWICYIPFWTMNLIQYIGLNFFNILQSSALTRQFSMILTYINAALNPFFYSVLPETRRKILAKTLKCKLGSSEDRSLSLPQADESNRQRGGDDSQRPRPNNADDSQRFVRSQTEEIKLNNINSIDESFPLGMSQLENRCSKV